MDERRSLDRIASAVAEVLGVPEVSISLIDHQVRWVAGSHGTSSRHPSPLCIEVATSNRPVLVQDTRTRIGRPNHDIVAFAGVPLPLRHGHRVGALSAFSKRRGWQDRDLLVLRSFAEAAAAVVDTWTRCKELLQLADRVDHRQTLSDLEMARDEHGGES